MTIIRTKDNGDLFLPGPADGAPVTTGLRTLLVSGQQAYPMRAADGVTPLEVVGDEERQRRIDTDMPPLRMICSIEVAFSEHEEPQPIGTGWLVGERTVVTAGHVLRWEGSEAKRVRVIPGRDRATKPSGEQESRHFSFHPQWRGLHTDPAGCDVAAIRLPQSFGVSWFGVAALTDATLDGRYVNIAGYPAEVRNKIIERCTELWWHANRIQQLTTDRIFYDVDTSGGQSGAPVMLWPDPTATSAAAPTVIGIHARGLGAEGHNGATRINAETLSLLGGWVDADNKA